MAASQKQKIAIIGAGLIGRAWGMVFARAGHPVALHDVDPGATRAALAAMEAGLGALKTEGLLSEPPKRVLARVAPAARVAEAVAGAAYVQESIAETPEAKGEMFAVLDGWAKPETIFASSTSNIPGSVFMEDLNGRARCLVAHPANPPHLIPLVELVPTPWTDRAVVARAKALLESVGQVPIVVQRELEGFILNRLQGALLNEAFRLVEEGYALPEDLDKTVKHGLGLRWSFMGPFETIDLNAPGGIADYVGRYGAAYRRMAEARANAQGWSAALVATVEAERRAALPADKLGARQAWRDRRLAALIAHQRAQDKKRD